VQHQEDNLLQYAIADQSRRLEALDKVHTKLVAQVEKRDFDEMPDFDVVKGLTKVQEQGAREMGDWDKLTGHGRASGGLAVVILVPQLAGAAVAGAAVLDVPGRIRQAEVVDVPALPAADEREE